MGFFQGGTARSPSESPFDPIITRYCTIVYNYLDPIHNLKYPTLLSSLYFYVEFDSYGLGTVAEWGTVGSGPWHTRGTVGSGGTTRCSGVLPRRISALARRVAPWCPSIM